MSEKFSSLEVEKQQKIRNAALKVFAEEGYEKASTNKIVKEAGIGKGMLFYYFKSKYDLYLYLIEYSLDLISNNYLERIDTTESDFIKRLHYTSKLKMEVFDENPYVFTFIGTLFLADESQWPEYLKERYAHLRSLAHAKLYDNIDYSLFRDDVDVEKAFHLIQWSIEGYEETLKKRFKNQRLTEVDMTPLWDEFEEYLHILKTSFYSREAK
ncbi:TetR/AcrR family transcriptional regulator [Salsuginibacillus kocurii]|uniref:TetR/AcrR family transcriptional regulator n=1 Tax=Salsuginibacillus kocurii TaxID=427078 RepID=UPI0003613237|nr:TetR/AcrR family transcriptional regulator [Salsuginibacillus kocurii]